MPDDVVVLPSDTVAGFCLPRSILRDGSPEAAAAAVDYARRVRLHPWGSFPDADFALEVGGEEFDARIRFTDPESYPVNARGLSYTFAFFSACHLGRGQFYEPERSSSAPLNGSPEHSAQRRELCARHDGAF